MIHIYVVHYIHLWVLLTTQVSHYCGLLLQ
jgi:hypothetical protein